MFEVNGYGNIFLVKADTEREAEARVHEWAISEGLSRVRVSVHEVRNTP
jgi:hypothetical protein